MQEFVERQGHYDKKSKNKLEILTRLFSQFDLNTGQTLFSPQVNSTSSVNRSFRTPTKRKEGEESL